ncbi:MAG: hypothetical protein JKY80_01935 [Mariprofundaceae bacterium]|nr:hypothetical protein [Mariprofundaceae bacterium]
MRRMSDEFTQLLIDNKEWVIGGVKFAIKWGGILLESFNRMLPVLGLMAGAFIAMKVATLGWAGAMAIAGAPIVVITAAIAALYLVVDDLVAAFSGGKSVIADFYNAMTGGDLVAELTTGFGFLKTAVDVLVDSLMEVWNLLGKIGDWMLSGGVSVAKFLGLVDEDSSATNMTAPMTLRNDGLPNADGSQMQDNRQVIQHNNITITTNDPQGTSRAVDSVLNRQLDNANTQLSVGGR